ncbi:Oligopeptide ABC transporter, periplasmic oligopeptide-binding protein OppA [Lachnospiraceae bacterium TWA4]|nr:Oligopeptide ABC transporter, periplasmic oligopeptide-binding protein OppA [Lachnospiraceae bacterium TWA4]
MKKIMKKVAALSLALITASTMMAGCSGGSNKETTKAADAGTTAAAGSESVAPATQTSDKVLKFACQNFSENIDPMAQTNAAWDVSRYGIGETLFRFDEQMNANNYLCDKHEVKDDGKTWELHIKDGVKFSNGNDCKASTVKEYLELIYKKEADYKKDPSTGLTSTPSKYIPGIQSIEADDSTNVVTIKLENALLDLNSRLCFPYFVILDPSVENMAENPVGTGPYAITDYKIGSKTMSMKANENYWNGVVPFKGIEISYIEKSDVKAMALMNGDVNLTENVADKTKLEALQTDENYTVKITPGIRCGFAYMNEQDNRPLANKDLRKAVLMAIDDETICNTIVGGMYTPGCSLVPSTLDYGYDQLTDATPFDVEGAKKILDDAGIVDSDGDGWRELDGKKITLTHYTYDNRALKELAEACQVNIEAIGIDVDLKETTADDIWSGHLVTGDYDLLSNNWTTAEIGDPYSYLDNWYGKSEANYCGYKNDEYDKLYEELGATAIDDKAKRKELLTKLQQILVDDCVALVHGYYNSNMIFKAKGDDAIKGATTHSADYYWITTDIQPAE